MQQVPDGDHERPDVRVPETSLFRTAGRYGEDKIEASGGSRLAGMLKKKHLTNPHIVIMYKNGKRAKNKLRFPF